MPNYSVRCAVTHPSESEGRPVPTTLTFADTDGFLSTDGAPPLQYRPRRGRRRRASRRPAPAGAVVRPRRAAHGAGQGGCRADRGILGGAEGPDGVELPVRPHDRRPLGRGRSPDTWRR